ncbi:MAG: response regulator transcription factor [Lachnospiraceae bacterium]|nr:response regulator transcription factor [Lachnospiraceae bacterium]
MYQIALCDDETEELNKTEQMLNGYEKKYPEMKFIIRRFESADELLDTVSEKNYMPDLVLMDIYMPGKIGIEAARELQEMGNRGRIIFLTTSKEHALAAFGVKASQYLVKPISKEVLFSVLDSLLEKIEEERRKYLLLRIEGRIQRIAINDIEYCEAQGKTQFLHLTDGRKCLLRITMGEIYEKLSRYQEFVRVGIAYVVNLGHIDSLNAQDICFSTGKKIYLPRGAYKILKEQYFRYYCEEN